MDPSQTLQAVKMRQLAARLRHDATQTRIPEFRHKMEIAASELEEAAVDVETRQQAPQH